MDKNIISRIFLLTLIIVIIYACYKVFEPFLVDILAASILVSVFYNPYLRLVKAFRGRRNLASFVMCILIVLLVIIPLLSFVALAADKGAEGFEKTKIFIEDIGLKTKILEDGYFDKYNILGLNGDTFKEALIEITEKVKDLIVPVGSMLIYKTTTFVISIGIILLAMFFLFVDGERFIKKLMFLTPLSNKYDKELFKKFRDVSYSTMLSTFTVAIAQGILGAIGFIIVGLPAFFAGVAMGFLSLLPLVGTAFVWGPVAIYLLFTGSIWQGIFLIIWGLLLVSTVDNIMRAYLIKGKAEVHPLFIFFAILGGIALFGFWGIVFGPLIVSLAFTIFHIYEIEYNKVLEK